MKQMVFCACLFYSTLLEVQHIRAAYYSNILPETNSINLDPFSIRPKLERSFPFEMSVLKHKLRGVKTRKATL